MRRKVIGWPRGEFVPGMLCDDARDMLFDVGETRDEHICDACVLPRDFSHPTHRQIEKRSEEGERKMCFAEGCDLMVDTESRNDKRRPLCEVHKRKFPVLCEDSTLVSFCFYCHRTHDSRLFNISKNVCDERYLVRKRKLAWKRLRKKQAKLESTPLSSS